MVFRGGDFERYLGLDKVMLVEPHWILVAL
jgi:hypothetical protein